MGLFGIKAPNLGQMTGIRTGSHGLSVGGKTIINQKDANRVGRAIQTGGISEIAPDLIGRIYGDKNKQEDLPAVDTSGKPLYPTLKSMLDEKGGLKKEYSAANTWMPLAQKQLQAGAQTQLNQAQGAGNAALQKSMGSLASRGGLTGGASERMALKSAMGTAENMMGVQDRTAQQGLDLATKAGISDLGQLNTATDQFNQQAEKKYENEYAQYQNRIHEQTLARQAEQKRREAEKARIGGMLGSILQVGGTIAGGFAGAAGGPAGIAAGAQAGSQLGRGLGDIFGNM